MKKIIIIFILLLININSAHGGANSGSYSVDITIPSYVGKLSGTYINDIDYRKKGLKNKDKKHDEYLVIPSNGFIVPVIRISQNDSDYNKLASHQSINVNNYLKDGGLLYPKKRTTQYSKYGNNTIFGHSSYFKNDDGGFKTHFQLIIGLEIGKEIWVYKKEKSVWNRYEFIVNKSYETSPSDINIVSERFRRELTLFTCTPIGNITNRWVVKAKYKKEDIKLNKLDPKTIYIGDKLLKIILKVRDKEQRNKYILEINSKIDQLLIHRPDIENLEEISKYFKYKLGVDYLL